MSPRLLFLPLALLAFGLAACDSADPQGSARFTVLLTDAPGDFHRAVVTIEEVSLQGQGGAQVLRSEPVTTNLLDLQNEVLALVEDIAVPAGTYSQLRLRISGGFVEVEQEDGSTRIYASSPDYAAAQGVTAYGTLQMPSFEQAGLRVNLPGGSVRLDDDEYVLLLDFNVAESFGQQAGGSGQWVMHPVIRASDFSLTGSAEVTLALAEGVTLPSDTLSLAHFTATLDRHGDLITLPLAASGGAYAATFRFVVPGTYPISITAPEGVTIATDRTLPLQVTVASGATAREALVLTDAQ